MDSGLQLQTLGRWAVHGGTMEVTRDGNMACARVGNLWLAAAGRRKIDDDTWRQYLEQSAASVSSGGPFHGVLFWAPKHGPSTPQRKMLTEEFGKAIRLDTQRRVALISDSAIVRGTITAIRWITRGNVLAFAAKDEKRALDWLAEEVAFDRTQAQRSLDEIIAVVQGQVGRAEPGARALGGRG